MDIAMLDETPEGSGSALTSDRFQISENLKRNTKGALRTAVDIMKTTASATQNVPYIGAISSVLAEVLKIQDEVSAYRAEWKAVAEVTAQVKSIVDDVRVKCTEATVGQFGDEALPAAVVDPFTRLETCLVKTLETLNECVPITASKDNLGIGRKMKGFALEVLRRNDLATSVKSCEADMRAALRLFNTRLQIEQTFTLLSLVDELKTGNTWTSASTRNLMSLPAAPAIFHGRSREIDLILDSLHHKAPARIVIRGSGGIGKTSIALTVLHHSAVATSYGDRRYFVSCEATPSAESLIQALLRTFGVTLDPNNARASPLDILLAYMRSLPNGILCLDNLETPWGADASGVEAILANIAWLPYFALLVTTRGADFPMQVQWTWPFLPLIQPISRDAALQTWSDICHVQDAFSVRLIDAVDCVPLAVTLLAQLAINESSEVIWERWESEQTRLLQTVHGLEDRLKNVDASIRLSLSSPIIGRHVNAIQCLSILCVLPQGLLRSRRPSFATAYKESLPEILQCITVLKQCALVYLDESGNLRVLSPIRYYMLAHHPPSMPLFSCLVNLYHDLLRADPSTESSDILAHAKDTIEPELANIHAVLERGLASSPPTSWDALHAVTLFAIHRITLSVPDTKLISQGILLYERTPNAEDTLAVSLAQLWNLQGETLLCQCHPQEALPVFEKAIALCNRVMEQSLKASCLRSLGIVCFRLNRISTAEVLLRDAIDLSEKIYDNQNRFLTMHALGDLFLHSNLIDDAEQILDDALRLSESMHFLHNHTVHKAGILTSIASMHLQRDELIEAEAVVRRALESFEEIGDQTGEARVLETLGKVYARRNFENDAEVTFQYAIELARMNGDRFCEINNMNALGSLYHQIHRHKEAQTAFLSAQEVSIKCSYFSGQASAMRYLKMVEAECNRDLESCPDCFRID